MDMVLGILVENGARLLGLGSLVLVILAHSEIRLPRETTIQIFRSWLLLLLLW